MTALEFTGQYDVVQRNFDRLERLFTSSQQIVTTLPTSPGDGLEVYYLADATNRVVWHLRYNASGGTYKWEFVGGPPLFEDVQTSETTASTNFTDLTTVGPTMTVPLAGEYVITVGARIFNAGGSIAIAAVDFPGNAIAGGTSTGTGPNAMNQDANHTTVVGSRKAAITGAGTTKAVYRSSTGATVTFQNRFLQVLPVRVA